LRQRSDQGWLCFQAQNAPQLGLARPLRQDFQVNDGRWAHAARRFALPITANQPHSLKRLSEPRR
jgi:hypothetical protein